VVSKICSGAEIAGLDRAQEWADTFLYQLVVGCAQRSSLLAFVIVEIRVGIEFPIRFEFGDILFGQRYSICGTGMIRVERDI